MTLNIINMIIQYGMMEHYILIIIHLIISYSTMEPLKPKHTLIFWIMILLMQHGQRISHSGLALKMIQITIQ